MAPSRFPPLLALCLGETTKLALDLNSPSPLISLCSDSGLRTVEPLTSLSQVTAALESTPWFLFIFCLGAMFVCLNSEVQADSLGLLPPAGPLLPWGPILLHLRTAFA